ncbi:ATP synthase F0 subunit C [Microvenator marinus]|jgi:F-type H+-transporting ATPase subunit c|uniref:ATP synthase subunit c n=1 Tax=Microvenator marinus TaxID=2600177 RepID=A0A5B8Y104_9DELT|nr:ATP synthase F0 subunit C [Microvenator marinus]QED29339.1 ATP synthase F0 subunit C [Microvenator marinus]
MKKLVAVLSSFGLVALFSVSAFAQGAAAADNVYSMFAMFALGAGFAIGVAAIGGALAQGRAAAAALEGIARNPGASQKLFTPLILGLALIESLVIYAFVIAILIVNRIDMTMLAQ